jgi:hypothetical protein
MKQFGDYLSDAIQLYSDKSCKGLYQDGTASIEWALFIDAGISHEMMSTTINQAMSSISQPGSFGNIISSNEIQSNDKKYNLSSIRYYLEMVGTDPKSVVEALGKMPHGMAMDALKKMITKSIMDVSGPDVLIGLKQALKTMTITAKIMNLPLNIRSDSEFQRISLDEFQKLLIDSMVKVAYMPMRKNSNPACRVISPPSSIMGLEKVPNVLSYKRYTGKDGVVEIGFSNMSVKRSAYLNNSPVEHYGPFITYGAGLSLRLISIYETYMEIIKYVAPFSDRGDGELLRTLTNDPSYREEILQSLAQKAHVRLVNYMENWEKYGIFMNMPTEDKTFSGKYTTYALRQYQKAISKYGIPVKELQLEDEKPKPINKQFLTTDQCLSL